MIPITPLLKTAIPAALALSLLLAACGNRGPLVLPPPTTDDAPLTEAAAVEDAGVLADPRPAGSSPPLLPPDRPPVEDDPDPPAPGNGNG
jgi:predicted small lipoprotein YifL